MAEKIVMAVSAGGETVSLRNIEPSFDSLWRWINSRGSVITVQERSELEHVFNLMRECDCQSYLEVGTAEGNSLYVLGHAVKKHIDIVDFGETHTEDARREVVNILKPSIFAKEQNDLSLGEIFMDSTNPCVKNFLLESYDCILIDGGHDFATVLSDSILYAPLATKYVFWHDIQLPEVRAAVEWFCKRWQLGEYSTFIASPSFGYGIVKVKQ